MTTPERRLEILNAAFEHSGMSYEELAIEPDLGPLTEQQLFLILQTLAVETGTNYRNLAVMLDGCDKTPETVLNSFVFQELISGSEWCPVASYFDYCTGCRFEKECFDVGKFD